jgi:hypothetical protein
MNRSFLKTSVVGLASLLATAAVSYGQLLYTFTPGNANEQNWSSDYDSFPASGGTTPISFINDPTLPAGLGTQAVLIGNSQATGGSYQQEANWGVSINADAYSLCTIWVKAVGGDLSAFQPTIQSSVNGWQQLGGFVAQSAGWTEYTGTYSQYAGSSQQPGDGDWANIGNIIFGAWEGGTSSGQIEIGGIEFTTVPEPSSMLLGGLGLALFGLYRKARR